MSTCLTCDFWNSEKERCDDPVEYVNENGELACRYQEGATPRNNGFSYVNITTKGCEGWINLFFGEQIIAMISDVDLASEIKAETEERYAR